MDKFPGWAAPLLGMGGGGLAGLALAGDPKNPFPIWQTTLGGTFFGLLAGLIVWFIDMRKTDSRPRRKKTRDYSRTSHSFTPTTAPPTSIAPPGLNAFGLLVAGLAGLVINHALVVMTGNKVLPLVVGSSFIAAVGLAGMICPQILTGKATGEPVPWWGHLIGGVFGLIGFGLGMYLWIFVY